MTTPSVFRPLNLAEQLADAMQTNITYAYDDLVFFEHSAVLLRFDNEDVARLHLYINTATDHAARDEITRCWLEAARKRNITLSDDGTFTLEQLPDKEELTIRFN